VFGTRNQTLLSNEESKPRAICKIPFLHSTQLSIRL
jgi:hypothetical protein